MKSPASWLSIRTAHTGPATRARPGTLIRSSIRSFLAALLAAGASLIASLPANAASTACDAANTGAYDWSSSVNAGATTSVDVSTDSFDSGERLLLTGQLTGGDASALARVFDTTGGGVSTIIIVGGPAPEGESIIYTLPSSGPRTFEYRLENTGGLVPAEVNVSMVCLDGASIPDLLTLTKAFTDDPVLPGDTATLEFTIQNNLQGEVTGITFTDDLDGALSGLGATDTPKSACGGTLNGTSLIELSNGVLAAGASCTFSVAVDVPASAIPGDYLNTSGAVSGLFGELISGSTASDTLQVRANGSITVVKEAVGGDGTFSFAGDLGAFDLMTVSGSGSRTFPDLAAGTYAVTETLPSGYDLATIVCNDGSPANIGTRTATIDLAAGESVICTFTNTAEGSITIVKETVGGDGTFSFTGDLGAFDLTTAAGSASTSFAVSPGSYDITESFSDTFILTDLVCDDGSSTNVDTRTAAIDLAAGESVICTFTNTEVTERTSEIIRNFLQNRARPLSETGPAHQYFFDRFGDINGDGFSAEPFAFAEIMTGAGDAAFEAVIAIPDTDWSLWLEGTYIRYRSGGASSEAIGNMVLFELGLDRLIGDRVILGAMVVGDGAREVSADLGYEVGGLGFMAGPYGAVRIGDNVIFDAKVLWGRSWNDIQPFMTYTDEFTTSRWLATARLAGEGQLGAVIVRPELYLAYFRETQLEYVDTNGITIPEQTIRLGRFTFGPELALPVELEGGATVEPRISLEGVWDFTTPEISARINGGFVLTSDTGASFSLLGGYGGLFLPGYSTWNISANITVPLR